MSKILASETVLLKWNWLQPVPPKRPMSAFFLFLNDIRAELNKESPKASVADISKLAG